MHFEESISYLLAKLATTHKKSLEKVMGRIGLHSGQVFVLFELWEKDGLRQVDLADSLNLSPPTVNKMLTGLIEGDLVTRSRFEDDARSTRIFLTERGRSIREEVEEQWRSLEETTLADLTETERLILLTLLKKLTFNYFGR